MGTRSEADSDFPRSTSRTAATKEDVKRLQTELTSMAAELRALRATKDDPVVGADAYMAPIKFKDAVGRYFSFPWHICKTWRGMESLVKQAFLHVDIIGQHVQEGHYDLMDPEGNIILPQLWESMIRPQLEVSMHMWPFPESPKKDKKTKKTKSKSEIPMIYDPNGEPIIDNPFAGMSLQDSIDIDTGLQTAKKKGKKGKAPTAVNPFLENYQPMPPLASEPLQPEPVLVEMPAKQRHATLEQRIKEVDRESSGQRHSSRSARINIPVDTHTPLRDSNTEGDDLPTERQDYTLTEEAIIHDGASLPEDSDAEDAMLDDEALKNKMLMRYAGGVATLDHSDPLVRCDPRIFQACNGRSY